MNETTGSILLFATVAMAACAPRYDGVTLEIISTPPVPVTVDDDRIELPAGVAVVVLAQPVRGGAVDPGADVDIELVAADESVLTVEGTVRRREFALLGNSPGMTCLDARIDGDDQGCIDVDVTLPTGG